MCKRLTSFLVPFLAAGCALGVSSAAASAQGPVWTVSSVAAPKVLPRGDSSGTAQIIVTAVNTGAVASDGSKITVADAVPAGLTVTAITGTVGTFYDELDNLAFNTEMACTLASESCTTSEAIPSYDAIQVFVSVDVASDAPEAVVNEASVSGGGATGVSSARTLAVGSTPAGFGIDSFDLAASNEDGSPDTQAGSHPYQLTTTLELNQSLGPIPFLGGSVKTGTFGPIPEQQAKDLQFELPPGLIGNPSVIPQCTAQQFVSIVGAGNECPADTAIGVAVTTISAGSNQVFSSPIFNLVPDVGEPARFGFTTFTIPVYLDTSVRSGGDYGVTVTVSNIPQQAGFDRSQVSFWGVPGDPSHDAVRGWQCLDEGGALLDGGLTPHCPASVPGANVGAPFLTLPTSCTGPPVMKLGADSWQDPGAFTSASSALHDQAGTPTGLTGCNHLDFRPRISVSPDGQAGSTPTGLGVDVHVPQEESLAASALGESEVKNTTVTLPAGVALSPGAADGLSSCTSVGIALDDGSEPTCPDSSKVATVEIKTPLLPNPLVGEAYLGAQDENPFGSLVALYIVAKDPVSGVLVKIAGQVVPDPVTGQLVSTFSDTPQLPFEDLKLDFFGSARAPLSTPPLCGAYTTQASIEPWSGQQAATPSSTFAITSGPNGTPCADPQPFAPSFTAGTTSNQAGGFSPFTLTMTRPDQDQTLSGLQIHMPPGLLGTLSTVKLCGEPQAAQGTCGEESLIGHTVVSAGLGGDPYTVTGGRVYITTGYKGAPYGLSIVNPAVAGPFDLGTVIVRAAINVDPSTAALTITSDPLPTIIDGIPLQLQHVNVTIDRPDFTFNPTSCNKLEINATLSSSQGQSAAVGSPFQVTNCAALAFKPHLVASTSAHTSRANGASLDVKLSYPAGPYDANIAQVKVELPKQLPSRLSTLQKACLAKTFEANPALCPAASQIGIVKASTPVLPVPLSGPAYFVSHGGEAFPSLIVVLQGYGVRVDLVGSTFISKQGITSSTFKTIPDVPVGTFELYLPEGKYSALAANGNLCKTTLTMPTTFQAQNGASTHQTTKITITGCTKTKKAKAKKASKAREASHHHTRTGRRK